MHGMWCVFLLAWVLQRAHAACSVTCLNGGTCVDPPGSYCDCTTEFYGAVCDKELSALQNISATLSAQPTAVGSVNITWVVNSVPQETEFVAVLGSRSLCGANSTIATWNASQIVSGEQATLWTIASYDVLEQCEFLHFGVAGFGAAFHLRGDVVLGIYVASGAHDVLLEFVGTVEVYFSDSAVATAAFSINDVVAVDSVETQLTLPSTLGLYKSAAFLQELGASNREFYINEPMFVQHTLSSAADVFYLEVQRVWFSESGEQGASSVLDVSPSEIVTLSSHVPGTISFRFNCPWVMNCRLCYLHVESTLTLISATQKSLPTAEHALVPTEPPRKQSHASVPLVLIQKDYRLSSSAQRQAVPQIGIAFAIMALAIARWGDL